MMPRLGSVALHGKRTMEGNVLELMNELKEKSTFHGLKELKRHFLYEFHLHVYLIFFKQYALGVEGKLIILVMFLLPTCDL